MKILNEFDAVRDGTFSEFKSFYSGNANAMNKYVNLNLLSLSMVNDKNEEEKERETRSLDGFFFLLKRHVGYTVPLLFLTQPSLTTFGIPLLP